MKIQLGKQKEDGSYTLEGSMSAEEANFISGVGIATLLQYGTAALMQMQEDALEDIEVEGPMQ